MGRTNSRRRKSTSSWSGLYQDMTDAVIPVGHVPSDGVTDCLDISQATKQPVRIVHTSDTHLEHDRLRNSAAAAGNPEVVLPDGEILVHTGDFNRYRANCCVRSLHHEDLLHEINSFFERFPHQLKVFVAGNHDSCLQALSMEEVQRHLPSCVYLCDSSTEYEGIKIYGSPYTASRFLTTATGFTEPWRRLKRHWAAIPEDTDVLVTHMPPLGILDLASEKLPVKCPALFRLKTACLPPGTCRTCGFVHAGREHWGCPVLRETVLTRVKPKLHLFGHVHESYGTLQRDNTVFSNGAFLLKRKYNVFDYYMEDCNGVQQG
ncbi:UPF0046 protein K07C11.7-like [Babylonia areolata]|uniref:UPF0046 protein K07C11.7-like n=1 Tax=Babylonia areolata TaxID=304850 RepID=UPI003FD676D9